MAAQQLGVDDLIEADRIGIGHQHDLATDQAIVVGTVEQAPEMVRDQEPRRLVGVKCGLNVYLGPGARPAIVMHGHKALGPRPAGGEGQASGRLALDYNCPLRSACVEQAIYPCRVKPVRTNLFAVDRDHRNSLAISVREY